MPPLRKAKRLPTVELKHKKIPGMTRVLNQTDYARDIAFWSRMWTVKSWRRGDATDDEVVESAIESDINKFRMEDPGQQKKRGDLERAYEERAITINPKEEVVHHKPAEDWRKMPWFKKRSYVKDRTGTQPKNAAHAEELMKGR